MHGKSKPKNWFSQTLTEDTRGVSNIEENSTGDTTTVKKTSYASWEGISIMKRFGCLWIYGYTNSSETSITKNF